jgi:cytochrome c peroxidase
MMIRRRPVTPVVQGVTTALLALSLSLAGGCALSTGEPEEANEEGAARLVSCDVPPILPVPLAIGSLKFVPIPEPAHLASFVTNKAAAIALGKALFWDMQAGSDGVTACASCHFSAGADRRRKNQLSPGLKNEGGAPVSQTFNPTGSGSAGGPNYTLLKADYPFHRLADIDDRDSAVLFDTDDVTSSQGVFGAVFQSIVPGSAAELCAGDPDLYQVGAAAVRRVEPRNTPTVINAVFNYVSFWDGRASNHFNGVDPFGERSVAAVIHEVQNGAVVAVPVSLDNASLASQAVGPPGSAFEMACAGRTFPDLARKLRGLKPLGLQAVDATDSVLGPLRDPSGKGLSTTYAQMIKNAFPARLWDSTQTIDGLKLMESNFSLFWGLAIQLYEATLVSDDTRFDQFMEGSYLALTEQEQLGMDVFVNKGKCIDCHHGGELTGAATTLRSAAIEGLLVERMFMSDCDPAIYDSGFYNLGVRPTVEDRGRGGTDPWSNPLSFARQAKLVAAGGSAVDRAFIDPSALPALPGTAALPDERDAVDGSFKVPTLRNVALTAPYFHNGGQATLEQVVDFYNRGGDRRGTQASNTSGFGPNASNADLQIQPLGLTAAEKAALVAFLGALTDERVRFEQAPFDHPALTLTAGHVGDGASVSIGPGGNAVDTLSTLPAVGKLGRAAKGMPPITSFLN